MTSPVFIAPVDAHQHFWKYSPEEYPWIPNGSELARDWLPADLDALQKPLSFGGSIAVQARQTLEETRWLLELADQSPRILGVVGWVDLRATDVADQLAQFRDHPRFVGVRHVVQDEPDPEFMLQESFLRGIQALAGTGLKYDILIYPQQLPAAIELVRRFPDQPFVLDHIAKPRIRERLLSPWDEQIRTLAQSPNVFCKLSGMVTEADHAMWRFEDFQPYLDVVLESFGPKRLMVGSDWPVCLLAASYDKVLGLVSGFLNQLTRTEQEQIFARTAREFYLQ